MQTKTESGQLTMGDYVLALVENAFGYGNATEETIRHMATKFKENVIDDLGFWGMAEDVEMEQQFEAFLALVDQTADVWINQADAKENDPRIVSWYCKK